MRPTKATGRKASEVITARWVEVAPDPDEDPNEAKLRMLRRDPAEQIMETVGDVVAYARGGVTWDAAMHMPLPALREAHRRLSKRWKNMTF